MNILGFNPGHHSSVCLLQDGELKYFIQEERIGNRKKYTAYPFRSFIDILQNYKIDYIAWGTPSLSYLNSNIDNLPYWQTLAYKYFPEVMSKDFSNSHHLTHVAHSFYNSGFKESIGIVIDGVGSILEDIGKNFREVESLYYCSYPITFQTINKNVVDSDNIINLSRVYETITMHLGWSRDDAGKPMGLAPYGNYNSKFPIFFKNNVGNPGVFYITDKKTLYKEVEEYPQTFINEDNNPQLKLQKDPREWHHDESKITNLEKDLAWRVQNDTQQIVGNYIENAIKETGLKQVCCSGGYFLNCVTNYYLTKRFPDVEFYFEPIANDAGTAIGAAKLLWYELTNDTTIRPFKSLYLGKQYSKKKLLKGIKKYT